MARKKIARKDKTLYLEFVWLAPSEHAHLVQLLGAEALERWIVELNGALGQHGYKYESHYYTIQNWARRAAAKKAAAAMPEKPAGKTTPGAAAAERIIEALKDPLKDYLPDFEEKTKAVIIAVMKQRGYGWQFLRRRVREDPRVYEDLRKEIAAEIERLSFRT